MGLLNDIMASAISKQNSDSPVSANVLYRGQPLGKWTGSAFQYTELQHRLKGTDISLYVIKE